MSEKRYFMVRVDCGDDIPRWYSDDGVLAVNDDWASIFEREEADRIAQEFGSHRAKATVVELPVSQQLWRK